MIRAVDRLHLKSVKLAVVRKLTSTDKGSPRSGIETGFVRAIARAITLFTKVAEILIILYLYQSRSPSKPRRLETKDSRKNTSSS